MVLCTYQIVLYGFLYLKKTRNSSNSKAEHWQCVVLGHVSLFTQAVNHQHHIAAWLCSVCSANSSVTYYHVQFRICCLVCFLPSFSSHLTGSTPTVVVTQYSIVCMDHPVYCRRQQTVYQYIFTALENVDSWLAKIKHRLSR